MPIFNLLSLMKTYSTHSWRQYLLDTILAATSVLLLTYLIAAFHLYPRIPNISIMYLLIVLPLASTRSRYASILASLIAFFSFDFFIVPPLFTFVIYRVEEWIALFVFLATAIFTGQLAATLRRIAEVATRHEQETAILYKLVRITNNEDQIDEQLHALTLTIVDVFSPWGISDCAILQADNTVLASAFQPPKVGTIHLYPLQVGQKVIGVLRLCIQPTGRPFPFKDLVRDEKQPNTKTSFFHIFLDQVASLVERAHLRQDHLRIELLQRTDVLRAALLTSVSHDLRTPLTAIKAAASSLLQEEVEWDNEARLSFALSIEGETDRLNRLVGNLLDMSRIEGGVLKPEKEWYPLNVLIHDVLNRLQPLLQQRDLHIDVPNDFTVVELDYVQIDQVLTNVMENALRYSPAHSPLAVSVHFEASEVIIRIADRGPGIPTDDLERIFDKFYRVMGRQALPEYPPGSGLGLAICKGVVEAHGGHIWAEQRPGGGSLFSITLPVGTPEGIIV